MEGGSFENNSEMIDENITATENMNMGEEESRDDQSSTAMNDGSDSGDKSANDDSPPPRLMITKMVRTLHTKLLFRFGIDAV